jgi:rhodanese-related sulfurtransferase
MLRHFNFPTRLVVQHIAAALLLTGLYAGAARADDTPETLAGAKPVAAEDVVKAVAGGAVLIDTRVASEYAEAHIKGAVNVPYREKSAKTLSYDASQDQFDLAKLPADKAAAVVMYCNGPECWKSLKASAVAIKGGYTNILWYRLGIPEWKSKGLPTEAQ